MLERINAGIMTVVPEEPHCIAAYRFRIFQAQRRLEHRKRVRLWRCILCLMRAPATRARAVLPKMFERITAFVPIRPSDFHALAERNVDVLGIGSPGHNKSLLRILAPLKSDPAAGPLRLFGSASV